MRHLYAVAVLLLAWAVPAMAAEKLAPLDADFLEYLASFGSDEEDWALFADEEPAADSPAPAKKPAAKRDESKTEAAAKPAEQR
jgi:hypothetical protein